MKKSLVAVTAVLLFSATTLHAQPYGGGYYPYSRAPVQPPQPSAQTEADAPAKILREGIDRMKSFLAGGVNDPKEVLAFLDNEIAPYFDFQLMSRWVVGRNFDRLSEAQKNQFTQRLKVMFFTALAKNLKTFTNPPPHIDIFATRARHDARRVSVSALVRGGTRYEQPVRMQFRFYRGKSGWKIYDVTANGISAVTYYRQYFNQRRHPYFR